MNLSDKLMAEYVEHLKYLESDGKRGKLLDWSGRDLHGLDLSGMLLAYADLSHANLSGADISGVNLTGANMVYANCEGIHSGTLTYRKDKGTARSYWGLLVILASAVIIAFFSWLIWR